MLPPQQLERHPLQSFASGGNLHQREELTEGMRRLNAFSPPEGHMIPTQSSAEEGATFNNEMTFSNP
jgi:hypothetical protein